VGYLDQYGAGEGRRETIVWRLIAAVAALLIVSGLVYYVFKNHHEQALVKDFLGQLRRQDYPAAYRVWGCSNPKNCSGYPYDKFLEDWGPKAGANQDLRIVDSESCHRGVIISLDGRDDRLWVDSGANAISFSPYPFCPGKSAYAIMLHRTVGQLRKPFF
jgi:hypothetical protein